MEYCCVILLIYLGSTSRPRVSLWNYQVPGSLIIVQYKEWYNLNGIDKFVKSVACIISAAKHAVSYVELYFAP